MKALLSKSPGGPETLVLEERPTPLPVAGEVVLQIKACGVNFPDVLIIQDMYQFKPPRPFAPGGEVAGIVTALGDGVSQFKIGDRVLASTGWGGMSEAIAVAAARCMPIPDAMPFDEASAFILTYGTSYHALKDQAGRDAARARCRRRGRAGRDRIGQGCRRARHRRRVIGGKARIRQGPWRR
jgi:NADPH2:quinone reductase